MDFCSIALHQELVRLVFFFLRWATFSECFTVLDVGCGDLIVEGRVKVRGLWSLSEGLTDSFDGVGQAGSRHQSLRQRRDSV